MSTLTHHLNVYIEMLYVVELNIFILWYCYIATAVNFSQPIYIVNENSGPVQLMLDLSNPSSTTIIVEVININITAIGKDLVYLVHV